MSDPPFTIRRAVSRADASSLVELIIQLAQFEKLVPPDEAAQARLVYDGFEKNPPRYEAWLAENGDGVAVGYALLFETYSTFLCRPTLYVEDIFVLPHSRGIGIGKELMHHCIRLARERGCGRMEWTCLDWNADAQQFYERIGACRLDEWYLYRLTADRLVAECRPG